MWETLLGILLGCICAVTGLLGGALIGYHILLLFGVSNVERRAAKWSVIAFGLPVAIVGFVIGYQIGSTLYPS